MTLIKRWKRTTPFHKTCCYVMELGELEFERCDAPADVGVYFNAEDMVINMVSLCHYHLIYQESIWITRKGEKDE